MIRVFLAGEGRNELGDWVDPIPYRAERPRDGVVPALLRKIRGDGWMIIDAMPWRAIRKFQSRPPISAETKTVLGLALAASEAKCDVLVFCRDRDGSHSNANLERERDIDDGIRRVAETFENPPRIAGGVAVKRLESWLCALTGELHSEDDWRPEDHLKACEVDDTEAMVRLVEAADLDEIPEDARSLRVWLERARDALEARETQPDEG